jgi:ubiquinone/menaquinone biosynthesis C-methylase UbiE
MIAQANLRAASAGVASWVTHQQASALALPFATASFDACRCERVLLHLIHPEQAVSEMVRVTKPDGWVLAMEPDWGTNSIATSEVDIERRLARVHAERCLHNGYIGRRLSSIFKQQQLREISINVEVFFFTQYAVAREIFLLDWREREAVAAGLVTEDELQRWRASLEQAEAEGVFFGSVCGVIVAGRR